jgi:hypothetical protein
MEAKRGILKFFKSGATRSQDAEKERFDLICPFAMKRLAVIYSEGAETHGSANWERGVPLDATLNHLERHLQLWKMEKKSGKKIDEDDHLAKVAWGAFALMHYEEVGPMDLGTLVPTEKLPPNDKPSSPSPEDHDPRGVLGF